MNHIQSMSVNWMVRPYTYYQCSVRAHNDVGASSPAYINFLTAQSGKLYIVFDVYKIMCIIQIFDTTREHVPCCTRVLHDAKLLEHHQIFFSLYTYFLTM